VQSLTNPNGSQPPGGNKKKGRNNRKGGKNGNKSKDNNEKTGNSVGEEKREKRKVKFPYKLCTVLMGPKSPDSTAGIKPATEAQLDSAAFGVEWFFRSCNLARLSMGFCIFCWRLFFG